MSKIRTRHTIVIVIFMALVAVAVFYATHNSNKALPAEEIATYIDNSIAPVYGGKNNNSHLLIYYFVDTHATAIHKEHCRSIKLLKEKFGVSLVGIEGMSGRVTKKDIDDEFAASIDGQSRGEAPQLAQNNAEIFGVEAKKIVNKQDFLEVYPLYNFVENDEGIDLFGVDPYSTTLPYLYEEREKLISLMDQHESEFGRAKNTHDRALIEHPQFNKDEEFQRLYQKLTFEYERGKKAHTEALGKLEIIINANTPDDLKSRMPKYDFKALNEIRGRDSVTLLLNEMNRRKVHQAILVFGEAHFLEIDEECHKRGVSYIIIGPRTDVRDASEASLRKMQEQLARDLEQLKGISKTLNDAKKSSDGLKIDQEKDDNRRTIIPDEDWKKELEAQKNLKK